MREVDSVPVASPAPPPDSVVSRPSPASERLSHRLAKMSSRGFRLLFVADGIVLFLAMVAINYARFGTDWPDFSLSYYLAGFAMATAIQLTIGYLVGLYEREPRLGRRPWLPRVAFAMLIGVTIDGFAFIILSRYLMPRLNLAVLLVVGTVLLMANRQVARALARRRLGPPRILLVGDIDECELARTHLAAGRHDVVDTVADTTQLERAVRAASATDVLLLGASSYAEVFPHPLTELEHVGVGVFQRVTAAQTLLGLHQILEVGGMPFVALQARSLPGYKYRLKRLLDVVVLVVFAPLILAVIAATALYVRVLAGPGILYHQTRVGRGGEPFEMVKFRTMHRDAEAGGAVLSTAGDPRVLRGLGWLRSTRLDETPQLAHVLTGKMSIVGPRPERPEFTSQLALAVPGYERRFELPPGLTGLAQVNGRYSTDAAYKIGYDLQYVADWTLLGDIQIMLRTVWVVLSRRV